MKLRTPICFLLLVQILVFSFTDAVSKDICKSCIPIEQCQQFGDMSSEQREQWNEDFPCPGNKNTVPGFTTISQGNYVCCPSSAVQGAIEDNSQSLEGKDSGPAPNSFNLYNHRHNPILPTGNSFSKPQKKYKNTTNFTKRQCSIQSLLHAKPPNPTTGCCGVHMSGDVSVTDLRQYLRSKENKSNWETQANYPLFEKKVRDTETPALDVTFEDRIADGRDTDLDQFPWTAYMVITYENDNTKNYVACGGSLISSRFLLSAAHCFVQDDSEVNEVAVILAEYDQRTFPRDCVRDREQNPTCIDNLKVYAENVVIHPNFQSRYLINDIALVRLTEAVPYTKNIRPICLPPFNIDSPQFAYLPLATAGWGLNVSVQTDIKQFTVVNMVPKSECKAYYPILTDNHLCASGKNSEDTCKGDSGGPLMMMYEGKYYVVGIVSGKIATHQCGTPVPSLYTNVYPYLNWIKYYTG